MAIKVGTTALPITAAIKNEYCASLTMPCVSPNNAEMLPKVSPVDISSVVYRPSRRGDLNMRVIGYTPTNLVAIFAASKSRKAIGAATSADTETNDPARMK